MIIDVLRTCYSGSKYLMLSGILLSNPTLSEQSANSNLDKPWSLASLPPVDCIISPHQIIDLSSAVPGVLGKLHKERSEFVEQGQIVAELTSDIEQAAVVLAKARAQIQSEIGVGKVNLAFAERQQARIDSLHGKAAISYQHKDEADREFELSQWEMQRAQDLVKIRNLELNKAQQELKQKTVHSPITGFVVKNFKHKGEYVEDQPIMRIAQLDPLNIEAIVPMALFGKIKPGMTANIQFETFNLGVHSAEITLVDKMGDAGSGTFGIRLSLPNPDYKIPAGLKCDLKFTESDNFVESKPHETRKSEQLANVNH